MPISGGHNLSSAACQIQMLSFFMSRGSMALWIRSPVRYPEWRLKAITSMGGQVIPMNKNSRVLRYEQQGVLYGPKQKFFVKVFWYV